MGQTRATQLGLYSTHNGASRARQFGTASLAMTSCAFPSRSYEHSTDDRGGPFARIGVDSGTAVPQRVVLYDGAVAITYKWLTHT